MSMATRNYPLYLDLYDIASLMDILVLRRFSNQLQLFPFNFVNVHCKNTINTELHAFHYTIKRISLIPTKRNDEAT